jgi:hypothetical protein
MFLFIGLLAAAQQDSILNYSKVVHVEGVSAAELYQRLHQWASKVFPDTKESSRNSDKKARELIIKTRMIYVPKVFAGSDNTKGWIKYSIKIQVKDGRYKYEFTDFRHEGTKTKYGPPSSFGLMTSAEDCPAPQCPASNTMPKWCDKVWKDIKRQIEENIWPIMALLEKGMTEPAKKEDW